MSVSPMENCWNPIESAELPFGGTIFCRLLLKLSRLKGCGLSGVGVASGLEMKLKALGVGGASGLVWKLKELGVGVASGRLI